MRIHLNLPGSSREASSSASTLSSTLLPAVPAPLTALSPNGELILIELQGELEIENQSPLGGQSLGTINFDPTRPERPILNISHHRLEGKFVNLVKPLAVLEKKVRSQPGILEESKDVNGKRVAEEMARVPVKRAKQAEGIEASTRSSSPPVPPTTPRRAREAMDFSSSPPRQTPIKPSAKAVSALKAVNENDSGSGIPDELDIEEDGEEEPQTAVYYDVVSVIKRKILFSKRPEPIVRLTSTNTQA